MKKRNAFTLVELLISIVLLALIFNYLFSVINSVKKRNEPYLQISKTMTQDQNIYKLISRDLMNATGPVTIIPHKHFDVLIINSYHSLYNLKKAFIYYYVIKNNNYLIRLESNKYFDIFKERNPSNLYYYGDIIAKDMQSFKVAKDKEILTLLFRSKEHKDMILTIPTVGEKKR